jgi:hypothetical protein
LAIVGAPVAGADIIYNSITRDISTSGSASFNTQNDSFNVSDTGPSSTGPWSSIFSESATVGAGAGAPDIVAWALGDVSQDSDLGSFGFFGSGALDIVAGTALGSLEGVSANAHGKSEFEVDFTLTSGILADFSASHSVLESGAAAPLGVIQLQGPGIDYAINNDTLNLTDILLLPGDYHFEAWVSGSADDLPGEYGGGSFVVGSYSFDLSLASVPEPSTMILLGIGTLALAARRKFKKAA